MYVHNLINFPTEEAMTNCVICKTYDLEFSICLNSKEGESKNVEEKLCLVQLHMGSLNVESKLKHLIILIFPQGFLFS